MTRKRSKNRISQASKQSSSTVAVDTFDSVHPSPQLSTGGSHSLSTKKSNASTQDLVSSAMNPDTGHDLTNKRPQSENDSDEPMMKKSKSSRPSHDQASGPVQSASQRSKQAGDYTFEIPADVQNLTVRYDFTAMSIISSSKLEQKIRNVLERVNKFNFADTKSKPGIVILHAKQDVATKMISIAEISKKEMSKDKGKWYQYTKLEGHVMEMKRSKGLTQQSLSRDKTLSQWQAERDIGPQKQANAATGTDITMNVPATDKQQVYESNVDAEQEEPAFETMQRNRLNQIRSTDSPGETTKVRNTGIMTIYLSRVPVPELKALYGEQTNA